MAITIENNAQVKVIHGFWKAKYSSKYRPNQTPKRMVTNI